MKLTPTVVVQFGALICAWGTLLLSRLELSPHEIDLVHALIAIVLGFFYIQIGYAGSLSQKPADDPQKRTPPRDKAE